MLKVGLVGAGNISGAHIPVWDAMENAELVALCDIRRERLENYPDKRCYLDFDEMLEKEDLDILDICLPTYIHVDFAVKAMDRGVHVLSEKPISLKIEDVKRAYTAAARNNVKFMIAQVLRFWPEYELLKEIYDTKKYGQLLSGYMGRLGSTPKRSWDNWMKDETRSGLVPYDLHIHDLDFMVYAFGSPTNTTLHRAKRPEQDYISVVYDFPGFFITAESSWYAAPHPFSASFRFQFEEAVITYAGGKIMIYENNGNVKNLSEQDDTGTQDLPKSNAYANEIRYFTDCVLTDKFPDKVKPEQLEEVIHILNSL